MKRCSLLLLLFDLQLTSYGVQNEEEAVVDLSAARLEGHTDAVYSVAIHPQTPELVATGSGDDTAAIWNR